MCLGPGKSILCILTYHNPLFLFCFREKRFRPSTFYAAWISAAQRPETPAGYNIQPQKTFQCFNTSPMESININELCYDCERQPSGECCSNIMADKTDGILLLINLIQEVDMKIQRDDDIECCYLGKDGCILIVKPLFCLNYNCQKIVQHNSIGSLTLLDKAVGEVLRKQVEIEETNYKKVVIL